MNIDTMKSDNIEEKIVLRKYSEDRTAAFRDPDSVTSNESRAALRQMSVERLMAYGVHYADAVELRARVWAGESWQPVAEELAQTCLHPESFDLSAESNVSRANRLFRASALVRMSQMMFVDNSAERAGIFARAGALYDEASALVRDRQRVTFETPNGPLTGFRFPSRGRKPIGVVVVIGGIEGWAMDFSETGDKLAYRGIEAITLDGPGQGESRMVHGHYLKPGWEESYVAVFDALQKDMPGLPIGFVGNSMGGAVALHLARRDRRLVAVCDNGGSPYPGKDRSDRPTFARKMAAHVGNVSVEDSVEVWKTIDPIDQDHPLTSSVLVVHGALDPVVSSDDAHLVFEACESNDKKMVIFSDGDHCVYNHPDDKHDLIGDWMADRLARGIHT